MDILSIYLLTVIFPFLKLTVSYTKLFANPAGLYSNPAFATFIGVFLNGNIESVYDSKCPSYGYYFGKDKDRELWKIYYPFRKTFRFIGDIKTTTIQGYKQLPKKGKLLVITKSLKDCMVLYSFCIAAIAPQSETQFISDEILEELKQRFKYIVLLFDSDETGIAFTNTIKRKYTRIKPFIIPRKYKAKDISDFYKKYGYTETLALIKEGIKYIKQWNSWIQVLLPLLKMVQNKYLIL